MKILITGAYSTGKSIFAVSLCERLRASGINASILPDSSREISFPLNTEQGHDTTMWLLAWQMSKEKLAVSMVPPRSILICDRGVPDILAHNLEATSRGSGLKNPDALKAAEEWSATYDMSFFSLINEGIPIEPDGLRITDPKYRKALEEYARETVDLLDPCFDLPFHGRERVEFAESKITATLRQS